MSGSNDLSPPPSPRKSATTNGSVDRIQHANGGGSTCSLKHLFRRYRSLFLVLSFALASSQLLVSFNWMRTSRNIQDKQEAALATFLTGPPSSRRRRHCSSPETNVTWPYGNCPSSESSTFVVGHARAGSTTTCGLCQQSAWTKYLSHITQILKYQAQAQRCEGLIVYSVSFGASRQQTYKTMTKLEQNESDQRRCKFLFILQDDIPNLAEGDDELQGVPGTNGVLLQTRTSSTSKMASSLTYIALKRHALPYTNLRRNVKLIKLQGPQLFFWARKGLIWVDGKIRPNTPLTAYERYYDDTIRQHGVCVALVGLPMHRYTVGQVTKKEQRNAAQPTYKRHCDHLVSGMVTKERPEGHSDSMEAIQHQCELYQDMMTTTPATGRDDAVSLDDGLIDSALIAWNMQSSSCRQFLADLTCTWADEIQCYADRDQLSFPFALLSMNLQKQQQQQVGSNQIFVHAETQVPAVEIVSSSCHWYFRRTFDCVHQIEEERRQAVAAVMATEETSEESDLAVSLSPPKEIFARGEREPPTLQEDAPKGAVKEVPPEVPNVEDSSGENDKAADSQTDPSSSSSKRVAILVAGTLQRFMLNSTIHHLIQPMVAKQGHAVDYYLSLTTAGAKAYRSDNEYMNHLQYDPLFTANSSINNAVPDLRLVESVIRHGIETQGGGGLRALSLRNVIDIDVNKAVKLRRKRARKLHPKDLDPDARFPMLDARSKEVIERTSNANRNLLRLHLAVQELWEQLEAHEEQIGEKYDYVLFLRDDSFWLADFDLNNLIATKPATDGGAASLFIPSCDARDPPLEPQEMNDHAVVAERKAAPVLGRYFTQMFQHADSFSGCQAQLPDRLTKNGKRGCNSEMLLKWIAVQKNRLRLVPVGQALLPFQRSVNVVGTGGDGDGGGGGMTIKQCFHKFCQSVESPLPIPGDLKRCHDLTFASSS